MTSSSPTPTYPSSLQASGRLSITSPQNSAPESPSLMNFHGRTFPPWSAGFNTSGDAMSSYPSGQGVGPWTSDNFGIQTSGQPPAQNDSASFPHDLNRNSFEQSHPHSFPLYDQILNRPQSMGFSEEARSAELHAPDRPIGQSQNSVEYFSPQYQVSSGVQQVFHSQPPRQPQPLQLHQAHALGAYQLPPPVVFPPTTTPSNTTASRPSSTLWFGDLEPWMDIEWFNKLCALMGWENVVIKIPQPNTLGHCFMTFPNPSYAAAVLAQFESRPMLMPGTKKLFNVNWANIHGESANESGASSQLNIDTTMTNGASGSGNMFNGGPEYSIFVGDLAPETTNADLVAVFRDPTLGLRSDREPRFIRPFTSCKSAKIMVDPVTGVSKGYGFVRFSEEVDQQRALIEMQGLYCLTRPMRISQATAKSKAQNPQQAAQSGVVTPQQQLYSHLGSLQAHSNVDYLSKDYGSLPSPAGLPLQSPGLQGGSRGMGFDAGSSRQIISPTTSTSPTSSQAIVSHEDASFTVTKPKGRTSSGELEAIMSTLPPAAAQALSALNLGHDALIQISKIAAAAIGANPDVRLASKGLDESGRTIQQTASSSSASSSELSPEQRVTQARALLATMIGPAGGVLNSTDPYNTTVFVGGLSGLISEDTLRTFFRPYGEIHYVKIPPGKGCGFVQFVRKADAERAIERMQGFPIGGGRVRLSWGRSQSDKAAQAAAQAAQLGLNLGQLGSLQGLSAAHTASLLQSLGLAASTSGGTESPRPNTTAPAPSIISPQRIPESHDGRFLGHNLSGATSNPDLSINRSSEVRDSSLSNIPYSTESHTPRSNVESATPRSYSYPGFSPFSNESAPLQTTASIGSNSRGFAVENIGPNALKPQVSISTMGLPYGYGGFGSNSDNPNVSPTSIANSGVTRHRSMTSTSRSSSAVFGSYGFFDGSRNVPSPDPRADGSSFNVNELLIRQERSGSDSTSTTSTTTTSHTTTTNTASSTPPSLSRGAHDIFSLSEGFSSLSFGTASPSIVGKDGRRSSDGQRGFIESDFAK
ncbi:RRM protein [Tulasnella sp. 419]|nr:RRM protein [Tulasnella sp. 419]